MSAHDIMPAVHALAADTLPEQCTCRVGDARTGHLPGCPRGDALRALLKRRQSAADLRSL